MSDKYFIDTNIFVYCFDDRQMEKKAHALALIVDALKTGNGVISWQVIQEFLSVSTRKFLAPFRLIISSARREDSQRILHGAHQQFRIPAWRQAV